MKLGTYKSALLLLGITSIALSRALFSFFDDAEGPNLLVVLCMSAFVYFVSLSAYFYYPLKLRFNESAKLVSVIIFQILVVLALYFVLT